MSKISIPQGFSLAWTSAGFKTPGRPDLSLIIGCEGTTAAGVFTTNLFKAAPVLVAQQQLANNHQARAVLINTGQANACTGPDGMNNCLSTIDLVAQELALSDFELQPKDILPASTGVIGAQLRMDLWENAVPALVAGVGKSTIEEVAIAMMTTDSFPKFAGQAIEVGGATVRLAGMAKGAGMICPNMATMLAVVLCDAEVDAKAWQQLLASAVSKTFNRVTVDGDTSTNDSVFGLASGASGVRPAGDDFSLLEKAVEDILGKLAYQLVQDGEGATKVMHIAVSGAATDADAEIAARTVGHSQLVKTAMYGKDANWGRVVAALGRSGIMFDPETVRFSLCGVLLFANGQPTSTDFDELLREPLEKRDLYLDISLGAGSGAYTLLASDLTHEYVNINAEYRS